MYDSVCKLIGESIRHLLGCSSYFVVESYESIECDALDERN